ncbi:MAG: hypothetical protein L0I95_12000 [Tetragenococcus koreensis]|nr:hypothetical protein [Tetragenococcus koreensis]MDN6146908.1 hypothetical protein [Tetragenococcus koreensis]MDN6580605.1 hypothetical protein [Tetragenococcus koreensis]GMG71529.1 hypothetical protein TEHOK1_22210 [Tetragenococcus halophilus]
MKEKLFVKKSIVVNMIKNLKIKSFEKIPKNTLHTNKLGLVFVFIKSKDQGGMV